MRVRFRLWWQQIQKHRITILAVAIILVIAIVSIIVEIRVYGTGFTGKTLWDWLQLLFIPAILTLGAVWLTTRQNHDREIAHDRHENDLNIAADNQREAALQAYIDKMSELLLEKKLRESQTKDEVRKIARVRTLTVLPRLDATRKRIVLRFLKESELVAKIQPIVSLKYSNLREADLHDMQLNEVDLTESDLRNAILSGANLSGANLEEAYLGGANLREANLQGAYLKGAKGITREELGRQTNLLKGATMPDGSIHP